MTLLWHRAAAGDGPAVLFVHGMTGTGEVWAPQVPAFVAAGWRPVVVDRRGAGRSGPRDERSSDRAADLVAVLDHLGVERAHLVGHAAGGTDVMATALRHPDRVGALVLTNTQAGYGDAWFRAELAALWTPAVTGLPADERELSAAYRAAHPDGVERWLAVHAHADHAAGAPAAAPVATGADLATLDRPVLVIAGAADLLTPPALLRRLAERIPGARFAVIARSAHVSAWERPEEWNALVLDFLTGQRGPLVSHI